MRTSNTASNAWPDFQHKEAADLVDIVNSPDIEIAVLHIYSLQLIAQVVKEPVVPLLTPRCNNRSTHIPWDTFVWNDKTPLTQILDITRCSAMQPLA